MNKIIFDETILTDALRILSIDIVQKANSGHPGAPMGMSEIARALWMYNLHHNPSDPSWFNRDRFILSNGHSSALIYALLHLTGYNLSIEELKNFRQLYSQTPGHPEVGITPGIETTTGPLGQGLANAVGMALAESLLAAEFNRPGYDIVNHYTYVFVGDGCLMEGISHEVCSLAGTLKLSKLIVLYDDNGISIDGQVKNWFSDDTAKRFEAYGWNVIGQIDGHNVNIIDSAIKKAKLQSYKPTLIICRTVIGKGSPNMEGTSNVHGSPLSKDEVIATRKALGWIEEPFIIPEVIYQKWDARKFGNHIQVEWQKKFDSYKLRYPKLSSEFMRRMQGHIPDDFTENFQDFLYKIIEKQQAVEKQQAISTRKGSQIVISALVKILPELLGGSADLTCSNLTDWHGVQAVYANDNGLEFGRYIHYGVREFGMSAIMSGLALHGGYLPFGGTFLTFSDYSRNAIRMAALMKQRVIYVFTHDSIGLGEDGPTHQSIEHIASLRLIPNLSVWRPCDIAETAVAWSSAIQRLPSIGMNIQDGGPTALILSRQNLPFISRDKSQLHNIARGGYIIRDMIGANVIIIATGSEVAIALDAQDRLYQENIPIRVVSMPSIDTFEKQSFNWKNKILPENMLCIAIEAGVTTNWYKYVGKNGMVIGIDRYGMSAPADILFNLFELNTNKIVEVVKQVLQSKEIPS